jgi:hypothetical protein
MKEPNLFACAARRLEKDPNIYYPCFAILRELGVVSMSAYRSHAECARFMGAFSDDGDGGDMSDQYCLEMDENSESFVDDSILALCFAAAMVDVGDL